MTGVLIITGSYSMQALAACKINMNADPSTLKNFEKYGGYQFKNFAKVCKQLDQANARIHVNAFSTVIDGKATATAIIYVGDKDTGISTSDYATMSTQVNSYANQAKANELAVVAINSALDEWQNLSRALQGLELERKKAIYYFKSQ